MLAFPTVYKKTATSGTYTTRQDRHELATKSHSSQTHRLTDVFYQAQIQQWVDIEVHQMGAGAYQGACTILNSGRMHLVHEKQNQLIHKTGILPNNRCTISFALGQEPLKRFSHFVKPSPFTFLLPANTELDILVPAHVDTLYLCLEQDRLIDGARTLNPRFWESTPRGLQAYNTPDIARLTSGMLRLLSLDDKTMLSPQAETVLLDSVLLALNQSIEVVNGDIPEYKSRLRSLQRVNRAKEFIDASLQAGRLPSIVDICTQSGTSVRSLQYAFREIMQLTPVAYLRILRLNKVRGELRVPITADTTVTRIATNWGFLHLGEFARDYLHLFGELPSKTLARARSHHTVG